MSGSAPDAAGPGGLSKGQWLFGGGGVASIIGALILSLSEFDASLDTATERMLQAHMEQKLAMSEMAQKVERIADAVRDLADAVDARWSRVEMHQFGELLEAMNRDIGLNVPGVIDLNGGRR